jgi:glutamate synthase domain-containing protein 2
MKPSGKATPPCQGAFVFIKLDRSDTGQRKVTMSRYHIPVVAAPAPFKYPANFFFTENGDYVKYGHVVFEGRTARGDDYWTAENITQIWYQAETGRIPISGAGYGGKFAGDGFDAIWLDMSEIVRPTRDGIHGRETISTVVDLGRFLPELHFDASGALLSTPPPLVTLSLPILFNPLLFPLPGRGALQALARAAGRVGTLAILEPDDWDTDLADDHSCLALRLAPADLERGIELPRGMRFLELDGAPEPVSFWEQAAARWPDAVIAVRLPLGPDAPAHAAMLARAGVGVIHLYADEIGRDVAGRPLPVTLRQVHLHLVEGRLRDQVSLIASGGIAAAEHVAKTIACGADAVAIDIVPMIAWGCALWADRGACPVETEPLDPEWGAQRLVNLMAAWRDQLLEALGAMGMREVRRLRGESGRLIFHPEQERWFKGLLGGTAPVSGYRRLEEPAGGEGDMRWTQALLLTTQAQARTGRPTTGKMEYRVGQSDGGFDRLAFAFEAAENGNHRVPCADPSGFDMSLALNRRGDGRPAVQIPLPWYGAGMSYGSVGLPVMLARAKAARALDTFTSTGEGGYPDELGPYADHIITQVATGLFGVREETIQRARLIEIKYAQGAKPGLGGHLLGGKNTATVAATREAVQGTSLFSPFPFHSVYSVEDHKKHVDWLKQINPRALISVKVSTPTDVDMVAVGSYYAGAHIIHLDGAYGGTGAAPEIAKKNIAMPIEYALPRVHRFLVEEGIRDEVVLMASGGLRTAYDVAKAIALGADGCVIGTAELVAIGCIRLGSCEKGEGCPFGITTTDPELSKKVDAEEGWGRIVNLYTGWLWQLAGILERLGMRGIHELRGRSDVLVYLE